MKTKKEQKSKQHSSKQAVPSVAHDQELLDDLYMRRALALAQFAYPAPNPQVGAVLVKNGKIIGEGYHAALGQPHAEIIALQATERKHILADGATLYVTLEPCSHLGKTPPCVDSIIVAGIKEVVIGCVDQHDIVHGTGVTSLVQAGVHVRVGVCGKECSALYKNFFHCMKTKRPYVTLKSAFTLDGKIAPQREKNQQPRSQTIISSEESRTLVQHLRKDHDAVLVGIGTVLADDPQLNCRIPCPKQPVSIIIDSMLRIPLSAKVLKNSSVLIATTSRCDKKKKEVLEKKGVRVLVVSGSSLSSGSVDIAVLLRKLPDLGILSVLVEGGSEVNASFLAAHVVDHLCFFICPKLFGNGVPIFDFATAEKQIPHVTLRNVSYRQIGGDILVEADL